MMNTMGAAVNAPQDRSSPVDRRRQGGTYRPRKDAMDLMTFYRYRVELRPHAARRNSGPIPFVETTPHAAAIAITRPTPKFGG
jgi:hypothetical protein